MKHSRQDAGFAALRIDGNILSAELFQKVAKLKAPRQAATDYDCPKGLSLQEEIGRAWRIAQAEWQEYRSQRQRQDRDPQAVGIDSWLTALLRHVLGYINLEPVGRIDIGERSFAISHRNGTVPLVLTQETYDLNQSHSAFGEEGRRRSPHALMQEFLNADNTSLWGLVSNGTRIRLVRNNPSLTRLAFVEADLERIFAENLYADFRALWLSFHASRLQPTPDNGPASCVLEQWRHEGQELGERALETLREGVTTALKELGNGFLKHPDNKVLCAMLHKGTLDANGYFQELLRLVYRLLFLITVEERDLLHAPDADARARNLYTRGYSMRLLRDRALKHRHYDRFDDLWLGLQVTFKALGQGAKPLGLPALGGLFTRDQCPALDSASLENASLLRAIHALCFFPSGAVLARVNYRDMGTEELGAVYESLIELQPIVDVASPPWRFDFFSAGNGKGAKGSERKRTGSYYTPPALVNELIKSTLEPVLVQAVTEHPQNPQAAILNLKVIDPACGSGHFLLAAARRMATEMMRLESGMDTSNETVRQQHALREVVQHCIYGVDRNPLATELCKTALWIETVEPGKPLTFLDPHIQQGDSLVGILKPEIMAQGIPGEAYKVLTGDDRAVCRALRKQNRQHCQSNDSVQGSLLDEHDRTEVVKSIANFDRMPEETLEDIDHKQAVWDDISHRDGSRTREELRANLFVGAYFVQKMRGTMEQVPHTGDLNRIRIGVANRSGVEITVGKLARRHSFFHWHLAFADIMQHGGFDVVLGNPPWERIKLQAQEFFASRSPDIATAPNKAARDRLIRQLAHADALPAEKYLWAEFETKKREAEAISLLVRTSGRFPLAGVGDVNTYAVFAELCLQLINSRGRAGLIVPTGIATDNSTKAFFDDTVTKERLVSLFDFENKERVFPDVHRSYKFCLLTLSGTDQPCLQAEFAFFLHRTEQLQDSERRFTLSASDFALFNPNTRTCPIFRTQRDLEIARKMYHRAGVFWQEARGNEPEVNPWGVTFQRMFDMSNDSGLFRTREQLQEKGWQLQGNVFFRDKERCLPLYEAKLFHQYDHRFATFAGVSAEKARKGNAQPITLRRKADPQAVAMPRYWIPEREVLNRLDKHEISTQCTGEPESRRAGEPESRRAGEPESRRAGEQRSIFLPHWLATRFQKDYASHRRADRNLHHDSTLWSNRFRNCHHHWLVVFRDIASPTNQRTSIWAAIPGIAVSNKAPLLHIDYARWLQAFRNITRATDERTVITDNIPRSAVGHSASVIDYQHERTVASALVLANMNSLPLDWVARLSVGGVNMNFFIVKQFPVLPPEAYLEEVGPRVMYAELILPRVLELTYTANDMEGFARNLGYYGPPFSWDDHRRHCLKCELDALFAHMYRLDRSDLAWILDAPSPSASFPTLKYNEIREFGEYRTQRYVLHAYEQLKRGEFPNLDSEP